MVKRTDQTFLKRRDTTGQETYTTYLVSRRIQIKASMT